MPAAVGVPPNSDPEKHDCEQVNPAGHAKLEGASGVRIERLGVAGLLAGVWIVIIVRIVRVFGSGGVVGRGRGAVPADAAGIEETGPTADLTLPIESRSS